MQRVAVINVVGLTKSLIGEETPFLKQYTAEANVSSFPPAFPAVTCTAQSSYVTGRTEAEHGIIANGWYSREDAEVKFWKQSNHIVKGTKIWDQLRAELPDFTCAKLFWWYNMYSSADYSITPRPMYPADGRKVFDVYTHPMAMREEIKADLGEFPFFTFWGPGAGLPCSKWIAESAKWVEEKHEPTLSLVYIPHLDYGLQKYGPGAPEMVAELRGVDEVLRDLVEFYEARGIKVALLSEYGISKVSRPIHLNRIFREKGWITIKEELGLEMLDCGASQVFAVADHQVAHVYVNDVSLKAEVEALLGEVDGVEEVRLSESLYPVSSPGSERAGDYIAVSEQDAWFTYYYWQDDAKAPDFARCVDIHRKPGYDPVELFMDPQLAFPKLKVAQFLLKKKLGLRGLLDVIPLDATLVKGSHGRDRVHEEEQPIWITRDPHSTITSAEDIYERILHMVRGANA